MNNPNDIAEAYWKWKKEIDTAPEAMAWAKLTNDCGRLLELFGLCEAEEVDSIMVLGEANKIEVNVSFRTGGGDYFFIKLANEDKSIEGMIKFAIRLKEDMAYEEKCISKCESIIKDMTKKIDAYNTIGEPCPPEFASNLMKARDERKRRNGKIKEIKVILDSMVIS